MQENIKYCELDSNKVCDNCNKCNICDLDPNKICDSCGKCLDIEYGSDYKELKLDGVIDDELDLDEYLYETDNSKDIDSSETDINNDISGIEVEYIEDIPELKAQYDKIIQSILLGKEEDESSHPAHNHIHDDNCSCHDHDHIHDDNCSCNDHSHDNNNHQK